MTETMSTNIFFSMTASYITIRQLCHSRRAHLILALAKVSQGARRRLMVIIAVREDA